MPTITHWFLVLCLLLPAELVPAGVRGQSTRTPPSPLLRADWGASVDSLRHSATQAGWTFLEVDEDGDYVFRAGVEGQEALVFATVESGGLARLLVSVAPHPGVLATWDRMSDSLQKSIGRPSLTSTEPGGAPPAASMLQSSAWPGVLMGLRRDGRIMVVLTAPHRSPALPVRSRGPVA